MVGYYNVNFGLWPIIIKYLYGYTITILHLKEVVIKDMIHLNFILCQWKMVINGFKCFNYNQWHK